MAKKITLSHLQETGTVATRTTARAYTHVIVCRYWNSDKEIARIQKEAANGYESFDTWTEAEKAAARVRTAQRIEDVKRTGHLFTVLSWHTMANPKMEGRLAPYLEMRVEAINNGVRA